MQAIDGFGQQSNGLFHGHANNCLRVYSDGTLAYKVVYRSLDKWSHHEQDLIAEYRLLSSLNHRGIVKVFDLVENKECVYFTMELLKTPLREYIKGRTYAQKKAILVQIEGIVNYLFRGSIIHGDIRMDNFFIKEDYPVLIDFQTARTESQGGRFEDSIDMNGYDQIQSCCGPFENKNYAYLTSEVL